MKRKIKVISLLTACALMFTFTACESSPDEVELASKRELVRYARHNYGPVSSYDFTEVENKITATFTDRKCGFTYKVTSYAETIGIDDAVLGYEEAKTSDFSDQYFAYLYEEAETEFGGQYDLGDYYCNSTQDEHYKSVEYFCCKVNNVSADEAESVATEIGSYFKKLDKRKYYKKSESSVKVYSGDEDWYWGSWHFSDGKYYYYADENIGTMESHAQSDINRPGRDEKEITYLYWEQMKISEVPGLEDWELVDEDLNADNIATLYGFDIDGEEHFYSDIQVWNNGNVYYSDMLTKQ